ncbi:MAG: 2-C-methyl-D-erythritol 4-phosphate cytidylyltransferase [Thermodesulfobacteriota bacterium]
MIRAALVTAAGAGTRMGSSIPKQYLDLHGIPMLARTLSVFQQHPMVDVIAVTVPEGHEDSVRGEMVLRFGFTKVRAVTPGGETRQESVYNGLVVLEDTDFVAIHDGARPLVGSRTITATFEAAASVGAALACVPVRDTIKKRIGNLFHTIPRADLWLAHTPQTFRTSLILEAHRRAREEGFEATDDISLVERTGHPVAAVEDSLFNIKITTPEDLFLARMLPRGDILVDSDLQSKV